QYQRADHHDRGEGGRYDIGGSSFEWLDMRLAFRSFSVDTPSRSSGLCCSKCGTGVDLMGNVVRPMLNAVGD
ncbi:MAG: hypothetical protein VW835_21520, partial [Rickettsiales bacterium]